MTERTKIERVGGHLLIVGCDFINATTGEKFTASSSYPIASLIVEEKPTHVTVSAIGIRGFFNVSGWTAREILEVAYGPNELPEWARPRPFIAEPEIPAGKALVNIDVMAQMKAKDEEIAVLREALRRFGVLAETGSERALVDLLLAGETKETATAEDIARGELAFIREAAKVGR